MKGRDAIEPMRNAATTSSCNRWHSVPRPKPTVGRLPLFEKPGDYSAFEKILGEAYERTNVRIAAYCLMPNHWHLLLWPRDDGELSEVIR